MSRWLFYTESNLTSVSKFQEKFIEHRIESGSGTPESFPQLMKFGVSFRRKQMSLITHLCVTFAAPQRQRRLTFRLSALLLLIKHIILLVAESTIWLMVASLWTTRYVSELPQHNQVYVGFTFSSSDVISTLSLDNAFHHCCSGELPIRLACLRLVWSCKWLYYVYVLTSFY